MFSVHKNQENFCQQQQQLITALINDGMQFSGEQKEYVAAYILSHNTGTLLASLGSKGCLLNKNKARRPFLNMPDIFELIATKLIESFLLLNAFGSSHYIIVVDVQYQSSAVQPCIKHWENDFLHWPIKDRLFSHHVWYDFL